MHQTTIGPNDVLILCDKEEWTPDDIAIACEEYVELANWR